nr:YiiX/YebB-like N1pC/P60 family cysteine hydrolase [Rhabdaerophilum calidifontis]
MGMFDALLDRIGHWLARRVTAETSAYEPYAASRPEFVARLIQPADVLLVEGGRTKIAAAIKYLTQSTWSHAALFVGEEAGLKDAEGRPLTLVEAELGQGIIASPLEKYASHNTRICRPVGLTPEDRARVIRYAIKHIGGQYDLHNVLDLARYLIPTPPVPARFRRRMIALGSGEPTRAICSTLIARAFEKVRYPILPIIEKRMVTDERGRVRREEVLHIRDSSLYTPRDFDTSPFFRIVKPTVEMGFDYKALVWSDPAAPPGGARPRAVPPAPVAVDQAGRRLPPDGSMA